MVVLGYNQYIEPEIGRKWEDNPSGGIACVLTDSLYIEVTGFVT
jgi:hypothetical protein